MQTFICIILTCGDPAEIMLRYWRGEFMTDGVTKAERNDR